MKYITIITILTASVLLLGCGKESMFESFTVLEESRDKSIVEPEQREFDNYSDYQQKREQLLREKEKTE